VGHKAVVIGMFYVYLISFLAVIFLLNKELVDELLKGALVVARIFFVILATELVLVEIVLKVAQDELKVN